MMTTTRYLLITCHLPLDSALAFQLQYTINTCAHTMDICWVQVKILRHWWKQISQVHILNLPVSGLNWRHKARMLIITSLLCKGAFQEDQLGLKERLILTQVKHSKEASPLVPTRCLSIGKDCRRSVGTGRKEKRDITYSLANCVSYDLFAVLCASAKEIILFLSNEFLSQ